MISYSLFNHLRPSAEKLLHHSFFRQARKPSYLVEAILKDLPPLEQRQTRREYTVESLFIQTRSDTLLPAGRKPSASADESIGSWDFNQTAALSPMTPSMLTFNEAGAFSGDRGDPFASFSTPSSATRGRGSRPTTTVSSFDETTASSSNGQLSQPDDVQRVARDRSSVPRSGSTNGQTHATGLGHRRSVSFEMPETSPREPATASVSSPSPHRRS